MGYRCNRFSELATQNASHHNEPENKEGLREKPRIVYIVLLRDDFALLSTNILLSHLTQEKDLTEGNVYVPSLYLLDVQDNFSREHDISLLLTHLSKNATPVLSRPLGAHPNSNL